MADHSATSIESARLDMRRRRAPAGRATIDLKRQPGFRAMAWACVVLLYAPILLLGLFSFNANRSVTNWTEFSLAWYGRVFVNEAIREAAITSLQVSISATVLATLIATAAALATTRTGPWPGQTASYLVINLPLMVPEIVTAIATLSFFALVASVAGIRFGLGNLIIAHTVFCIPFAYLPIRARLEDMDLTLEQAAADLYATPWQCFRRITLPLLSPGISAGAALAFIVSFDDFTISVLVAGPGQTTLPIYIWGALRRGITPEINAASSILLGISVLFVTLSFLIGRHRRQMKSH
jgi:spermidine/putrescine transport system permease protein